MSEKFFFSWGMILSGVLMNVLGMYMVKAVINKLGSFSFDSFQAIIAYFFKLACFPVAILGAIFILIAPLPYAIALSRMEISIAYPVSVALTCLILLPLTVLFLGESINGFKIAAIGLILVGGYLLYK